MSITADGVKFTNKPKKGIILLMILGLIEFVLTIFLVISLSANILFPERSEAVIGVSRILSYQGRLTDANGNPLGGSGTNYCFRFSIFNESSGGTRLWPVATPNSNTVNVVNGVFNVGIGGVDDLSTFDFSSDESVFLNVEVNTAAGTCTGTWENLAPRQRIDAVAYAREAFDLYGGEVRVGTGAGASAGSQRLVRLDVVNVAQTIGSACGAGVSDGALWYNSSNTRALVCDAGTIQEIGNLRTIVGIREQTAGSAITSGTVVFSAITNITITQDGQTLRFSGPAAGAGAGATLSFYANILPFAGSAAVVLGQTMSAVAPFILPQAMSASFVRMPILMSTASTSLATTANTTFSAGQSSTFNFAVYSLGVGANSRSLQLVASTSVGMSAQLVLSAGTAGSIWSLTTNVTHPFEGAGTVSFTSSFLTSFSNFLSTGSVIMSRFTSVRMLDIPFNTSLSAGAYWLVHGMSTASGANVAAATNLRPFYSAHYGLTQPNLTVNPMGGVAAASFQLQPGVGSFSTVGGVTTASLGLTNISSRASHWIPYFMMIRE